MAGQALKSLQKRKECFLCLCPGRKRAVGGPALGIEGVRVPGAVPSCLRRRALWCVRWSLLAPCWPWGPHL